jgi:poly-gamma-glutamate synthesis protein (capsule biosynthesis protein)
VNAFVSTGESFTPRNSVTLFLCGDVMTGRGVDQIFPHPSGSHLFEPYVRDAREYVRLAESRNGPIAKPVTSTYIWGDALAELASIRPDARIVNLETSVTASDEYWKGKGINYRMHPENIGCLPAARIDVCGLANNHVLDYGYAGLAETLEVLARSRLSWAGAGRHLTEARAPALVPLANESRIVVFAFGTSGSGIPPDWAARENRPGVDLLPDVSERTAASILDRVRRVKRPRDIVLASIHWGSNWGYEVPPDQVRFAHSLLDGGVDLVHGHSSHHPRPIEVYRNRLILYGCGDFINDYEGIEGYEEFRGDLVLMYFPELSAETGELIGLRMKPMQLRKLRLNKPSEDDSRWVRQVLDRISARLGTHVDPTPEGGMVLRWR